MTQTINHSDPAVATLQESVRHNEKNIDKLDRDLKDFRSETLKQFDKVNDRINQLETKVNDRFNQMTMLLVAIVGLMVTVIVKLFVFD